MNRKEFDEELNRVRKLLPTGLPELEQEVLDAQTFCLVWNMTAEEFRQRNDTRIMSLTLSKNASNN